MQDLDSCGTTAYAAGDEPWMRALSLRDVTRSFIQRVAYYTEVFYLAAGNRESNATAAPNRWSCSQDACGAVGGVLAA